MSELGQVVGSYFLQATIWNVSKSFRNQGCWSLSKNTVGLVDLLRLRSDWRGERKHSYVGQWSLLLLSNDKGKKINLFLPIIKSYSCSIPQLFPKSSQSAFWKIKLVFQVVISSDEQASTLPQQSILCVWLQCFCCTLRTWHAVNCCY